MLDCPHQLVGAFSLLGDLSAAIDHLRGIARSEHLASEQRNAQTAREALTRATDLLTLVYGIVGGTRVAPSPMPAKGGLAGWQVRAIRDYIDTHLGEHLSIGDLAATARISTSYLCKAFQATFQCSTMDYVRLQRIERAKTLMRETALSLCQISLECGFADQSHFTRTFGSQVGMTPRAWRLAARNCSPVR